MTQVHYVSRAFLLKQGVRYPPRTPAQIRTRLRRQRPPSPSHGVPSCCNHSESSRPCIELSFEKSDKQGLDDVGIECGEVFVQQCYGNQSNAETSMQKHVTRVGNVDDQMENLPIKKRKISGADKSGGYASSGHEVG